MKIFPRLCIVVMLIGVKVLPANAQIAFWQKLLGGSNYDRGKSLLMQTDGTLVLAGDVYSTNGLGEGNHSASGDWVILKYATQEKVFWKYIYGGTGREELSEVIATHDMGFLCIGTSSSPDGDVGQNYGGNDIWLLKLDPLGRIEWSKVFGGSGDDQGITVIETEDGGYLVGGESGSANGTMLSRHHGGLDSWIVRLDKNGEVMWEKHFGGSGNEKVTRLHELEPGRFLVINSSDSQSHDVHQNLGLKDCWVFEMDDYGQMGWQMSYGGEDNDDIHGSVRDHDGGIVMVGTTFSIGGHVSGQRGLGDFWALKISPQGGGLLWSQTYGGRREEGINDIILAADSNYVICGMTKSRTGEGDIEFNGGYYDGWIAKIDRTGKRLWSRTLGYEGAESMQKVLQLKDGGFLTLGYSQLPRRTEAVGGYKGSADFWLANFGDPHISSVRPYITPPLLFGVVKDKDTGRFIEADIILTNNATLDSITGTKASAGDGSFVLLLPTYGLVSINVVTPGYLFYGQDILLDTLNSETSAEKIIELEAIRIGSSLILRNIYFETGKWDLLPASNAELERVVKFMKLNPRVHILVSGHTDNTGNNAQKAELSLNRANAVKKYLLKRGIIDARMKVKGFGQYRPIAPNTTPEGRQKNRRVEFEVINK
ncbi:MAG: OmpA family protein [Bacteroidia bacterium]|nr:OmpA family protein [Bacteroidia bacterium]